MALASEVVVEQGTGQAPRPARRRRTVVRSVTPYLLCAPAIAIVVGVLIYPLLNTIYTSLWRWNFSRPDEREFIGFANYLDLFYDGTFRSSAIFTLTFTLASATLEIVLAMACAIAIHRSPRFGGVYATVLISPFMLASIATGFIWRLLFNRDVGVVNYVLSWFGIEPISWLTGLYSAMVSVVIAEVWQFMPFVMLILLAGLKSVPLEVEQAARVDGSSEWQVFKHVTLPLVVPSLTVALIFQAIFKLRVFDIVVALTAGGPGSQTTPIGLLISRTFLGYFDVGRASAMSVLLLIAGAIVATLYMRFLYREIEY